MRQTRSRQLILMGAAATLVLTGAGSGSCFAQEDGAEPTTTSQPDQSQGGQEQTAKPAPIYDEQADAREQIATALKSAKKENRRVLIQWGANWCGWCHLLHGTFNTNPEVRRKLLYEYDVVLIDIGKWDKNRDLAEKYGADLQSNGVPFLTVLDSDGNLIANQETGSLETKVDGKAGHDPEKVVEFLEKHQAAYLPAESILQSGLARAKAENKRVLLHFGAPWCGWCHKLEGWMAGDEVAKLLANDFVEVKIDIDRTIGGIELLERYRGFEQGGIPWFVFLGSDGAAIVTSDGPAGNVGCPYTDEELGAFREMLAKAAERLSAAQIDTLIASLKNYHERPAEH